MAYSKINWQDDITPVSATNLNKMDQGIADAHTQMADLVDDILLETTLTENLVEIIQNVDPNIYELVYLFLENLKSSTSSPRYLYMQFNDDSTSSYNFLGFETHRTTVYNYSKQTMFYISNALSQVTGNKLSMKINLNTNTGYYELNSFLNHTGAFGNLAFENENPISKIKIYPDFDAIGIGTKIKIIGVKKVV